MLIKEGRFTDNIKTVSKFYLYRDFLTLCQLQKSEHIFELMLACVSHEGLCLNALYEVSLTDYLGFLVSTKNTGHCLVHPKPVSRPAKSPALTLCSQSSQWDSRFTVFFTQPEAYFCSSLVTEAR